MDILIVDDEKIIRDAASMIIEKSGHYSETAENGRVALDLLRETSFDLILLDIHLGNENGLDVMDQILAIAPQTFVVVFTAVGSIPLAVEAMQRGALDFLQKPFSKDQLNMVLARAQKNKNLADRVEELETEVTRSSPENDFASANKAMQNALDTLFRAADTKASILILGESGTGKSLTAKAVHERSRQGNKPFVTVNCPSLSRELLESELFGHVKGSFTGAIKDHWGKVKAADGGTLFLDEIGELPMEIQPKLLRLLQEREYERLGETQSRQADVRVIAATNQDLNQLIAEGKFREDLLFRLNVITVELPSLRQRAEDIESFASSYLRHFANQYRRKVSGFSPDAVHKLLGYEWPGNLRELRNTIERAVILSSGKQIQAHELTPNTSRNNGGSDVTTGNMISLESLEEIHIKRVLNLSRNLQEAAKILGIDQATLYRKRKKLGLDKT